MVKNKMSWIFNVLLVGVAAMVVVLPSPSEIRKALEYGQSTRQITIQAAPEQAVIEVRPQLTSATRQVVIAEPEAVDCLEETRGDSSFAIQACILQIVGEVVEFDRLAEASQIAGNPVYPDPEIEEKRLALVNLCRAAWSAGTEVPGAPSPQQCRAVTVGVDY